MSDNMFMNSGIYMLENTAGSATKFVTCTIPEESPYFYTWWTSGKPLKEKIEEPIIYHVYDHDGSVEDFPFTNAGQFLISSKLYQLLKESGAKFDSYRSNIIIEDTGIWLKDYYTINFIESYPVLERQLSDFDIDPDFPESKVRTIRKLVVKATAVPKKIEIFKLAESRVVTMVSKKFKEKMITAGITGVVFKSVEQSS